MKKPLLNQLTKGVHFGLIGVGLIAMASSWQHVNAFPVSGSALTNATVSKRINVTGTVTDSKGLPLPGVSVKLKGSSLGTTSDVNGVFRLNLPEGDHTLVFTFVGYTKKEVKVGNRSTLNVTLEESSSDLEEVVVTGYGTQKKSQIAGSVATIKGSEIQDIPAPNIAAALRNRIAGVGVSAASGRPGASITINVRNSSSSEQAQLYGVSNEPLYVIDGIIVTRNDFDAIDPSMVENMSILKDAAAAIYGAAGAKGVILITTKRGQKGKPSITYNGYGGISDMAKKPEMLSAYDHALLLNDGFNATPGTLPNLFFSETDLATLRNSNIKPWIDEIWESSATMRHNLSISGGSDKITFFAGGSMQTENGNYAGLKVSKYGFRTGITATITDDLKADIAFNVDYNKRKSSNGFSENDQNFYQSLITTPRWVPIAIDGMPVNFSNINANSNSNPLAQINSGYLDKSNTQSYRINASLTYTPRFLKGLTAKFQISQGGTAGDGDSYRPPYLVYNFLRTGNNSLLFTNELDPLVPTTEAVSQQNSQLRPSLNKSNSYQGFLTLGYAKTIGKHDFNIMVGGEQSESSSQDLSVYWRSQLLPGLDDWWAFDPNTITRHSRSIVESVKRSFFGRANYTYANRYSLDVITRVDASSNFATGKIWGVFPSVGLGWIVSEENFFKENVSFMNYLKLRVNYGVVGDDRVAARLWQDRYVIDPNGYSYNETLGSGMNPSIIANPDITWESARTLNFGIETSLFNDKITFGVDLFKRWGKNMFDKGADQTFPMYAGFNAPVLNYQNRETWGSEFTIGYRGKIASAVGFNTSVNFGYGNSRTTRMLYNQFQLFENSYPDWKVEFGTDPRTYNSGNYGLIAEGMFRSQEEVDQFLAKYPNYTIDTKIPQAGWLYFKDTNGDGKITERDIVPMNKRNNPFISLGINLGFSYKAFSLNTNIAARLGGKEFYDSHARKAATSMINVPTFWKDHWSLDNPNATFPKYNDASIVKGWQSTFWERDGTMIRVNNMTLAYRLPAKALSSIGIQNAKLLFTGNNLWTLVNPFDYKDPYSSYIYDYPTLRTLSVGLSVSL